MKWKNVDFSEDGSKHVTQFRFMEQHLTYGNQNNFQGSEENHLSSQQGQGRYLLVALVGIELILLMFSYSK